MTTFSSYTDMRVRLGKSRQGMELDEAYALLCSPEHGVPVVAAGSGGSVYSARLESDRSCNYALKIGRGNTFGMGNIDSGSYSELAMLRYLKTQYIDTGLTPHLQELLEYSSNPQRVCTVSKFAEFGDLNRWIRNHGQHQHESVWRVLIFQLAYTLAWLERLDPLFRHNDLYTKNVLVYSDETEGCTRYILPDRRQFRVPNVGFKLVIADFGLASIPGKIDNIDVLHYEVDQPGYGMGPSNHVGYDLYRIVRDMIATAQYYGCAGFFYSLIKETTAVWNEDLTQRHEWQESPQIRPTRPPELYPTCASVLRADMFYRYVDRGDKSAVACTRAYGSLMPRSVDCEKLVDMLIPIDIGTPRKEALPDFMFGAQRNAGLFAVLPSARTLFVEVFNSSDNDEDMSTDSDENPPAALKHYEQTVVDTLIERLFYNASSSNHDAKHALITKTFAAVLEFLEPSGVQNLSLLVLCLFFAEQPWVQSNERRNDFASYCYELHVHYCEAVLLQYGWLKMKMRELGKWPIPL